jgi:hypothetical protein
MLLAAHRREGPTPVGSLPDCCSSLRPSGGMDGARAEFAIEGSVAQSRMNTEAGDGARTHDPQLGKLMLYQLSYARAASSVAISRASPFSNEPVSAAFPRFHPGFGSNTREAPFSGPQRVSRDSWVLDMCPRRSVAGFRPCGVRFGTPWRRSSGGCPACPQADGRLRRRPNQGR